MVVPVSEGMLQEVCHLDVNHNANLKTSGSDITQGKSRLWVLSLCKNKWTWTDLISIKQLQHEFIEYQLYLLISALDHAGSSEHWTQMFFTSSRTLTYQYVYPWPQAGRMAVKMKLCHKTPCSSYFACRLPWRAVQRSLAASLHCRLCQNNVSF